MLCPRRQFAVTDRSVWQVCLATILIGLVLFNPFSLLISQSNGSSYDSMARHRATVGSSEMQHFSPVHAESAQDAAVVDASVRVVVVCKPIFPAATEQDESNSQQPELLANIWFRPPPTV